MLFHRLLQPTLFSFIKQAGWIYAILTFESKIKGGYILTLKGVVNDSLFMPKFCQLIKNKVVFIYVKNQSNDQATHITNTQNEKIKRLQIIFQILPLLGEV